LVEVFAPNLNECVTTPDLHFTVTPNATTFGDDDHVHVLALCTVAAHLTLPPLAVR
jgi:hypothetical protein